MSRISSTRNTPSEGFNRYWRVQFGDSLKDFLQEGLNGICDLEIPIQRSVEVHSTIYRCWRQLHCSSSSRVVYYFVMLPLVRTTLSDCVNYWNHHRIRKQNGKVMASGQSPLEALDTCTTRGEINCLLPLHLSTLQAYRQDLHDTLMERTGSLECLDFFTPAQSQALQQLPASHRMQAAGAVTRATAWDYYQTLLGEASTLDVPLDFWLGGGREADNYQVSDEDEEVLPHQVVQNVAFENENSWGDHLDTL